jgi:hypothetical protein
MADIGLPGGIPIPYPGIAMPVAGSKAPASTSGKAVANIHYSAK